VQTGRGLLIARHLKALALIGHEPGTAEHAKRELNDFDRKHLGRVKVPASVREWYETPGAVEILREYSNEDKPLSVPELRLSRWIRAEDPSIPLDVLEFLWENQGVCVWAVALTGEDDPPVVVRWNEEGDLRARRCADTFSTFVFTRLWDFQPWVEEWVRFQAQEKPVSEIDLGYLRSMFREGPTTYTAACFSGITHRFEAPEGRIVVGNYGSEGTTESADWYVYATSLDDIRKLERKLQRCEAPPSLYET